MAEKLYKPLSEQISFISIETPYFSHKGVNYKIIETISNPHIHVIKNCNTGGVSKILHTQLLLISET